MPHTQLISARKLRAGHKLVNEYDPTKPSVVTVTGVFVQETDNRTMYSVHIKESVGDFIFSGSDSVTIVLD
jgi:hypothetical protein